VQVQRLCFTRSPSPGAQLRRLLESTSETGVLLIDFLESGEGQNLPWSLLERWIRSRLVSIVVIDAEIAGGALDLALCSDLVVGSENARLVLPPADEVPSPGLTWALGRAGNGALRRCLLDGGALTASEGRELGLVHQIIECGETFELRESLSVSALTIARDLQRCTASGSGAGHLELAAFRYLFAVGDPGEGALAFFERRRPDFRPEGTASGVGFDRGSA